MKEIDLNGKELDRYLLRKETKNMTKPCVFRNMNIGQGLENISVVNILELNNKKFESSFHSGAYWSEKPLISEVKGRAVLLDLEKMFEKDQGGYYVTYFQRDEKERYGWQTYRTCGNNEFDDFLAERTIFKDYMIGSYLHNHWVSNGGTESLLHADPVDTFFVQVKGWKHFTIIPESLNVFKLLDFRQPHKLKRKLNEINEFDVDKYEFDLGPGDAIFMPAWCFHEIKSREKELNISLTSHYKRERCFYNISLIHIVNRFRRFIYPKLVGKRRIQFQLENLDESSEPFFPWFSSFVRNEIYRIDTSYQYEYLLINRNNGRIFPVKNKILFDIFPFFDGFNSISSIAKKTNFDVEAIISICAQLIEDEFIQIIFEGDDRYNYFYQTIEARR
ncbi:cupin-like domain-containing protein [Dickeya zeae]|uniref:cupin-like domain-containing protein n=1 Tax=Dickeya zeae TaxID=204042 RepID=UPI0020973F67|nr:cupin-like domain-containing protein [Dickeya zeae]MCO7261050.1 cupin-like domain-containing protein [Dickeya zeae]